MAPEHVGAGRDLGASITRFSVVNIESRTTATRQKTRYGHGLHGRVREHPGPD